MLFIDQDLFRGAIIENTFFNIEAMARKMFPYLGPLLPYIQRIGWHTNLIMPELRLPVLFVTGDEDEIVPYTQTLDLHDLAYNAFFKDIFVIRGGTHNDSWFIGGPEYLTRLQKFMRRSIREY